MERCVIVGGAGISNYEKIRKQLRPGDFVIFCDSGLRHRDALGVRPDLIVGDFDSYVKPDEEGIEIISLPREKDDTDSVYAVKEALRRGYEEFLLLGMVGERLDHTLGNVSILLMLDSLGKQGLLVDDWSEMEIVSRRPVSVEGSCAFFSLLALDGTAGGVYIENAKYPLENGSITCDYQYGISNEVLPGKTARVSVKEGRLLLVRVCDKTENLSNFVSFS